MTNLDSIKIEEILERCDVLVQKFIPEVAENGENSYIFIDGEFRQVQSKIIFFAKIFGFSHATWKGVPNSDEFRIQVRLGGKRSPLEPTLEHLDYCQKVRAKFQFIRVNFMLFKTFPGL